MRDIQVNCTESERLDLRQAKAVKTHKPDILILEYPNNQPMQIKGRRHFGPCSPMSDIPRISTRAQKLTPWVRSDIAMWKAVTELRKKGHNVSAYAVDAPREIVTSWFDVWKNMYPCALKNWLWWVRIYIRERIMAEHVKSILQQHHEDNDLTILVFLQSFHWKHVQFLLTNPTKRKIWEYYFSRFHEITPNTIGRKIKDNNPLFYRYWQLWHKS
ncbi:MAG: hypothetical protein V1745_02640 [Patescibacteria group bacterium]